MPAPREKPPSRVHLQASHAKLVPKVRPVEHRNFGGGGMTGCARLLCDNSFRGLTRSPYLTSRSAWFCDTACVDDEDRDEAHESLRRERTAKRVTPLTQSLYQGTRIKTVAAGTAHSLLLTMRGGLVYSCGAGDNGRLGHGDESDRRIPSLVRALSGAGRIVVGVAAGWAHSLAVCKHGGAVYAFGAGGSGRSGSQT